MSRTPRRRLARLLPILLAAMLAPLLAASPSQAGVFCADPGPDQSLDPSRVNYATDTTIDISWSRYGCYDDVQETRVLLDGTLVRTVPGPRSWLGGTARLSGLTASTSHAIQVIAVETSGALTPITTLHATTAPPPVVLCADPGPGPLPPTNGIRTLTPTSATIYWGYFGCLQTVVQTDVYLAGKKVQTNGPSPRGGAAAFTNLTPETTYAFRVVATTYDGTPAELYSGSFTTPAVARTATFTAKGSTLLRTSGAAGTFALNTGASLTASPSGAGAVTGSILPVASTGSLKVAGLIPVSAKLTFGSATVTGTYDGGAAFTGTATEAITITKATVLGVTLTQNGTCHTAGDVTLPLSSLGAFSPAAGGKLTSSFTLPAFTGCGGLGSFLATTKAKSALALTLAPAAPAAS